MSRILFIGSYPNEVTPYACVFFRNLIYALADIGVECHVIAPVSVTKLRGNIEKISRTAVETTSGGNKVYVYRPRYVSASAKKVAGFNTGRITKSSFVSAAQREAKRINLSFDAVYGHFFVSGGLAAIKIGRKMNIPSFVAYGECSWKTEVVNLFRPLKSKDIKGLTGIISVSQKNTQELKDAGIFEETPVFTCENAVEMSLFGKCTKEDARKKFNLPKDKFIVGFVGGFIERKGDKRLLEACRELDGVYLAFAGKGDNPPKGENVVFSGSVNHEEIGDFLEAVDAFCLPTLNEGCCNAVLEAMAAGKAIVSSDLPFNDGVLTEHNSIRINPNSIDEIRNAVIKLRDDKEFRETIASKAKEDSQNYTIEKRAERVYGFLHKFFK